MSDLYVNLRNRFSLLTHLWGKSIGGENFLSTLLKWDIFKSGPRFLEADII